jgi:hypothetical protein
VNGIGEKPELGHGARILQGIIFKAGESLAFRCANVI